MSWDILPKANLQYFLQKLKTIFDSKIDSARSVNYKTLTYDDLTKEITEGSLQSTSFINLPSLVSNIRTTLVESVNDIGPEVDSKASLSDITYPNYGINMYNPETHKLDILITTTDAPIKSANNDVKETHEIAINANADWVAKETAGAKTVTGNPLTITDAAGIKEEKIEIVLDPKQDFHGYSGPWVGGAGKNKLNATERTQTSKTVQYTMAANNFLTVNGTSTGNSDYGFLLDSPINLKAGDTIYFQLLNFSGSVGSNIGVWLNNYETMIGYLTVSNVMTIEYTCEEDVQITYFIYRHYLSNVANNYTANVSLSIGEPLSQFYSYENICPIQGYDIVSADRCGKNLWGGNQMKSDILSKIATATSPSANEVTFYPNSAVQTVRVLEGVEGKPFKENTQYTFIVKSKNTSVVSYGGQQIITTNLGFFYTDGTNEIIYHVGNSANTYYTSAIKSNASKTLSYIRVIYQSGYCTFDVTNCGIFEGNVATSAYEPYNGQSVSVQVGNKNLIPNTISRLKTANTNGQWTGNSYVYNGITVTVIVNDDNNIIGYLVNGTSTGQFIFYFGGQTLKANVSYTLTGCPSGGASNTYRLANIGGDIAINDFGQGGSVIPSADVTTSMAIYIPSSGVAINNLMFYPMLRLSSITDPTFSPYNPSLGDMIYGGQLTLNDDGSAVFVGDRVCLNGSWYNYKTNNGYKAYNFDYIPARSTHISYTGDCLSNCISEFGVFSSSAMSKNIIEPPCSTHPTTAYLALKDDLSADNVQLSYKIDTPFTIHLSPVETLTLLQGINNIWTDGTTLSLTYQPDNAIGQAKGMAIEVMDYAQEIARDNYSRNLLNNDYYKTATYDSITGSVASFFKVLKTDLPNNFVAQSFLSGTQQSNLVLGFSQTNEITSGSQVDRVVDTNGNPKDITINYPEGTDVYIVIGDSNGYITDAVATTIFSNYNIMVSNKATAYEPYIPTNKELWEMIKSLQN